MSELPALIRQRLVTPSQANALRGVYQAILQTQKRDTSQAVCISDSLVQALLETHPHLVSELAPLLSDQQVARIVQET